MTRTPKFLGACGPNPLLQEEHMEVSRLAASWDGGARGGGGGDGGGGAPCMTIVTCGIPRGMNADDDAECANFSGPAAPNPC